MLKYKYDKRKRNVYEKEEGNILDSVNNNDNNSNNFSSNSNFNNNQE